MLSNRALLLFHFLAFTLVCVTFFQPDYYAFADYPPHLARLYIANNLDKLEYLQQYYYYQFHITPYYSLELIFSALNPFFDVYTIGKIIIFLIFFFITTGTLTLNYAIQKRIGIFTFLIYPYLYNIIIAYGLLSFGLSIGLLLLGFGLWILLENKPTLRYAVGFCFGIAIFFTHAFGYFIYGLLIFAYDCVRNNYSYFRSLKNFSKMLIYFTPLTLIQFYFTIFVFEPADFSHPYYTIYGGFSERITALLSFNIFYILSYQYIIFFLITLMIILKVVVLEKIKTLLLLVVILSLLIPKTLVGIAAIDLRLPIILPFMAISCIRFNRKLPKEFSIGVKPVLFIFLLSTSLFTIYDCTQFMYKQSEIVKNYATDAKIIPAGHRMLTTLYHHDNTSPFKAEVFHSIPAYVAIENQIYSPLLYTYLSPLKVKKKHFNISLPAVSIRGLHFDDFFLSEAELDKIRNTPLAEGYDIREYYWLSWRKNFDYVTYIHFGNVPKELPIELERIVSRSNYDIYKIRH